MRKFAIAAAITSVVVALFIFGTKTQTNAHVKQVQERFPEIDPTIIETAYRSMLKDAWSGNIEAEIGDASDEVMDELFMKDYVQPLL